MIALAKKRIVLHTLPASARHAALILMTCIPQIAVDFSLMLPRPGVSDKREAPASLADGYPRVISLGERRDVCGRMYGPGMSYLTWGSRIRSMRKTDQSTRLAVVCGQTRHSYLIDGR